MSKIECPSTKLHINSEADLRPCPFCKTYHRLMKCETCAHKAFYIMVTSGRPFYHFEEIPCLGCKYGPNAKDNYIQVEPSKTVSKISYVISNEEDNNG